MNNENIVTKVEIADNDEFISLPEFGQLYAVSIHRVFTFLPPCFRSGLLQICCKRERIKIHVNVYRIM